MGSQGTTVKSFSFLQKHAKSVENFHRALMVDDTVIRKQIKLVGNRIVGYVDLQTGIQETAFWRQGMDVRFNMCLKSPVEEMVQHVEATTREQFKCAKWFAYRAG